MTKSLEISVKTNPAWVEYVSDVLIEKIGCSGTVIDEKYYQDEVLTRESAGIVKGYKNFTENNVLTIQKIQEILFEEKEKLILSGVKKESLGSWKVSLQEIPDEEWADNWKKHWHPQKISEKIVICPSWETYSASEHEIIINLDPGSAFGTGTHPTTRLCVQAIEKIIPEFENIPIKMADIGTGSGILAVVGIKLGVESAVGIDNDPSVISVAKENAEKNSVSDKCNFYTGIASNISGEYELVTANILAHVLIETMPELVKLLKSGGKLVLSGIIASKSLEVQDCAVSHGLKITDVLCEDSWVAIIASS